MFDITADDIARLNDIDLRELVARLCEADLATRGMSPAAVTWGGNQTAADGGLDVRVGLPPGSPIDGFIPRASTGFQVKKPDMPRAGIMGEMRPGGAIRPVIQELADAGGAYVIVSSAGSTTDSALRNRQDAMRDALVGVGNASRLHADFYDRTRLATWVRRHSGLITWVKEKVGRSLAGWRPYGPWSGSAEDSDAEYLLDDKLRLHFGIQSNQPAQSVVQAIDELRDMLAHPGKIVRLVGLSGVGKTRLVQALFDSRIGTRPLSPALAVYTNLSDDPDPQPTGLASDLIANGLRAVLVVDNCPPGLHHRLAELCTGTSSTISVITVEYDVRDDQPESTQVVTLDTSSPELIQQLVRRRYPHLSQVDARTIADASGGNARIAIALAETIKHSESVAGLSNDELFQRLFRQRHEQNNALLRAAQACSLVYSFEGEKLAGQDAELPRLAAIAGQAAEEVYGHVAELTRRDLVQRRGVWRAVLPHAIANRLAARALDDIPLDIIKAHLVQSGSDRLARSFTRRLSYLHDHPRAVAIVGDWLAPNGPLGNLAGLDENQRAMFENVAPVLPDAALAALERADTTILGARYLTLLRSLAYDPMLFERSAQVLARAATQLVDGTEAKKASDIFVSLFTIVLSGTHATIEQRLATVEQLLRAGDDKSRTLGLASLENVLKSTMFSSHYRFEFGARSRDFGFYPRTDAERRGWYGAALTLVERLALGTRVLESELRGMFARNFRSLWTFGHMHDELERMCRALNAGGFWREGWAACRQVLSFDSERLGPDLAGRAAALEAELRPSSLADRVRAVVLGSRSRGIDLEDVQVEGDPTTLQERLFRMAHELGAAVVAHDAAFSDLLPELLRGGCQAFSFGRGLASASSSPDLVWSRLVGGLEHIGARERDGEVLRGFIAELWQHKRDVAESLLDSALHQPALHAFLPALHTAVELDARGVERIKTAVSQGHVLAWMCRTLAFGQATDRLEGGALKDLVLFIADQPDGFPVALEILAMRLHTDASAKRNHMPLVIDAGRELLRRITFRNDNHEDFELAQVVSACLNGPDGAAVAAEVASRVRQAVAAGETYSLSNNDLLKALFEVQPVAVLDALFAGDETDQQVGVAVFEFVGDRNMNPVDVIPCETLIAWCEGDRQHRYQLAASIISFARGQDANGPPAWSEQAKALLAGAPGPKSALAVLIERFRPMSWSGSRSALIEANAKLLDSLDSDVAMRLSPFITEAKAQLAQEIARERESETRQDRAQDERFE